MTAQQTRWRLGMASCPRTLLWLCGCFLSIATMAQPNPLTLPEALRLARPTEQIKEGQSVRLAAVETNQKEKQVATLRPSLNYQ